MAGEKPDTLILSVALASGRFKTELRVPFPSNGLTDDARDEVMKQWADFVAAGFRIGATSMDAVLKDPTNDR